MGFAKILVIISLYCHCEILLAEPKGVVNTGQEITDQTAENDIWI
ncbi:DSBH domain containing protein [Bacillus amyloliquefaciens]|nr:hypothetical protein U471_04910 [Bacillus amyloliquefaciens CC178]QEY92253.1 DSBH domain containing protein [Bacillus amyloliquefaciens]